MGTVCKYILMTSSPTLIHCRGSHNATKLLAFRSCSKVTLKGFRTAGHTGWFALLATDVQQLHIADAEFVVTRDGLDIVGCKDVLVERTSVTGGGDDAIVLKSDWSLGKELATRNITVRDTVAGSLGNNCLQIGSETIGNFSNILFQNIECVYSGQAGIGMATMDGAHIHNITYKDISMRRTAIPISMYVGARQHRPEPRRIGSITDVVISNLTAADCFSDRHGPVNWAATLDGQPVDPAYNATSVHTVGPRIIFRDIDLSNCSRGGGTASMRGNEPNHTAGEGYV